MKGETGRKRRGNHTALQFKLYVRIVIVGRYSHPLACFSYSFSSILPPYRNMSYTIRHKLILTSIHPFPFILPFSFPGHFPSSNPPPNIPFLSTHQIGTGSGLLAGLATFGALRQNGVLAVLNLP